MTGILNGNFDEISFYMTYPVLSILDVMVFLPVEVCGERAISDRALTEAPSRGYFVVWEIDSKVSDFRGGPAELPAFGNFRRIDSFFFFFYPFRHHSVIT